MKKISIIVAALGASMMVAGCDGTPRERAAAQGGLLGAATGAVVGAAVTGRASGALAGAAIGGVGGAVIGSNTAPRRRCARVVYDYYGNAVCRQWYYD